MWLECGQIKHRWKRDCLQYRPYVLRTQAACALSGAARSQERVQGYEAEESMHTFSAVMRASISVCSDRTMAISAAAGRGVSLCKTEDEAG